LKDWSDGEDSKNKDRRPADEVYKFLMIYGGLTVGSNLI